MDPNLCALVGIFVLGVLYEIARRAIARHGGR